MQQCWPDEFEADEDGSLPSVPRRLHAPCCEVLHKYVRALGRVRPWAHRPRGARAREDYALYTRLVADATDASSAHARQPAADTCALCGRDIETGDGAAVPLHSVLQGRRGRRPAVKRPSLLLLRHWHAKRSANQVGNTCTDARAVTWTPATASASVQAAIVRARLGTLAGAAGVGTDIPRRIITPAAADAADTADTADLLGHALLPITFYSDPDNRRVMLDAVAMCLGFLGAYVML